VLGAERADGPGVQPEQPPGRRLQAQVAGGQHTQHVPVRDQRDIAVGQQRRHPAEHLVGPLAYLFHGLAGMFGVAGDHAVPP
jgi:hypothetical protein